MNAKKRKELCDHLRGGHALTNGKEFVFFVGGKFYLDYLVWDKMYQLPFLPPTPWVKKPVSFLEVLWLIKNGLDKSFQ